MEAVKNPAIDSVRRGRPAPGPLLRKLTEIPEKVDFFDQLPDYGVECFTNKKSKTNPEDSQAMLEAAIPALEGIGDWTADAVHDTLIALADTPGREERHPHVAGAESPRPAKLVTPGGAVEHLPHPW